MKLPASPTLACVLLVGLGPACEQPPELRYETEHLRIGTGFEEPLCQGDLEHFERIIASAQEQLGTTIEGQVELYVWGFDWGENTSWCPQDYNSGCFTGGAIYSSMGSVDHELVHAVVATLAAPAPFWSEGAAEALQSNRTLFDDALPSTQIHNDLPELNYFTAGHFSRWLIESYGPAPYRALLSSNKGALDAFESAYDIRFEQAEASYLDQAPYSYGARVGCEHPALVKLGPSTWSEQIEVDCAQPGVRGGPNGMGALRVVEIAEAGLYSFSSTADVTVIGRCKDEDLATQPVEGDPAQGDIPPVTPQFQQQFVQTIVDEDSPRSFELAPGRYEITVAFSDHQTRSASLEVEREPGG